MTGNNDLGLNLLSLRFAIFAVRWAGAVIRLLQLTMWLCHGLIS
jgi:hypothetical protein